MTPDHAPVSPTPAWAWRSPDLGLEHEMTVAHGPIRWFDRGRGPAIVFAHGWLANANLWRKIVPLLADHFRCVTLDLPFGSHRVAVRPDADLTPSGCGRLIASLLEALDLSEVTLVGNDSGGAYSQIATAAYPERVGRLVLNACETPEETFPPAQFQGLKAVAATPAGLREALAPLASRELRASPAGYGLVVKRPIDERAWDSYALPCLHDDGVVHDASRVMRSASEVDLHAAAARLGRDFTRPVLFAWPTEDQLFPMAHAEAFARTLRDARVEAIADSYSFTPEDQPHPLADAIRRFASTTPRQMPGTA